jgi:hypothetical protein
MTMSFCRRSQYCTGWRHIEPTAFCDVCGADNESIRQVLIECTIAKQFWREVKLLARSKLPELHLTYLGDGYLPARVLFRQGEEYFHHWHVLVADATEYTVTW